MEQRASGGGITCTPSKQLQGRDDAETEGVRVLVWVVDAVLVAEGEVVIEGVPDAVCDRVCV